MNEKKIATLLPTLIWSCLALLYKLPLKHLVLKVMQKPQQPKITSIYKKTSST